jgi:SAM-dependent methyltransferase
VSRVGAMSRADVAAAYDSRADEYIEKLGSIEQMAPPDRATIGSWAAGLDGPVLDAGCGPGHWSDVLRDGGRRTVVGVDLSARFVATAHQRFPHVGFVVGDLAALPIASGSVGGILAWFSIIHIAPRGVSDVLREFARVLVPGRSVLLGYFDGDAGERFDHAVTTAYYWSADSLGELLAQQGFVVEGAAAREGSGGRREGHLLATLLA